jgi:Tol biopolymer transport system component
MTMITNTCLGIALLTVLCRAAPAADSPAASTGQLQKSAVADCRVREIKRAADGLRVPSPDGKQYVVSSKDAQGVYQVYVGKLGSDKPVCISGTERPGSPKVKRHKMQVNWHPSGQWIIMAAERDEDTKPFWTRRGFPGTQDLAEGLLQCGLWTNIYAAKPDGSRWFRLSDFGPAPKADGFTGVAFTPDGKKGVWAQIVDGNTFKYTFGKWQLILADFQVDNSGIPSFTNLKNISPKGANWLEPGNFSPDGKSLLITADIGFPDPAHVEGMDQFILDVRSGKVTNLTNSPKTWDEHGVFSPNGEKILFMSSYPYRNDPKAHHVLGLKTEFMLVNKDGSGLQQLTHFNQPGYPEYSKNGSVAANGVWSPDGRSIDVLSLHFPGYETWTIRFDGPCGGTAPVAGPPAERRPR